MPLKYVSLIMGLLSTHPSKKRQELSPDKSVSQLRKRNLKKRVHILSLFGFLSGGLACLFLKEHTCTTSDTVLARTLRY